MPNSAVIRVPPEGHRAQGNLPSFHRAKPNISADQHLQSQRHPNATENIAHLR